MHKALRSIAAAALIAALASAGRAACVTATTAWNNTAFTAQTAAFTATFQMIPGAAKIDAVAGLSAAAATDFTSLAAAVRFNSAGTIDARNGGAYAAVASVPYAAAVSYSLRMSVDPVAHRYSAWVTPAGGVERQIASNYAFRTEQALTSQLANLGLIADTGSDQLCGFFAAGTAAADTTAPVVSIGSPASGATLFGSAIIAGTASDNVGVTAVEVAVDNGAFAPAAGASAWSYILNTSALADGLHSLIVRAKDAAGNLGTAMRGFSVLNAASGVCQASVTGAWKNTAIPAQAANFTAAFDAIPSAASIDAVTGLSQGSATDYTGLAAIVRFNSLGKIDARNGSAYAAAASVPYAAGLKYKFRLLVEPALHRYSVWVTPPTGSEVQIASNYAFRTEQALVSSIGNLALAATAGTHQVCSVTIAPAAAPADTTAPSVSLSAPAAGATVSGLVSLTASASDNVGVAGVKFVLDGVSLGEVTAAPYALTWDSTKAVNGSHVLTAVARDAAGNTQTSAAATVNVANTTAVAAVDRFGVKMLYSSISGGLNWTASWDNGSARTFTGIDPQDAWFDAAHGAATYNVDGKGLFSITGATPRMYIHDPAKTTQWRDVEMTVYAMRVADDNTAYAGIVGVARSNHGTTGSETANLCDTRGYGARMRNDGAVDFDKETSHPYATAAASKTLYSGGLPKNVWIGYKFVAYDLANGDVKLEVYQDATDGAGGGTWVKVDEFEDTGANFGVGAAACVSGMDPALRLTGAASRLGSESGKPNISVYWRSTNVGTNGLLYKKMSVREITPTALTTSSGR